ncbi:MAG: sterol desaturase [Halioglobus sp.]|mgnify:CR=1 FL=1|nr:sterol desaturase [Halioglobus sp.]|tara:strand:+ start:758 stop:1486 length:729 start_codon:yes stop_codon:yes gene_type:complete
MWNEWLDTIWAHYNFLGSLAALALIAGITIAGKKLLFMHPELAEMRRRNKEEDKKRWKKDKYPPMIRSSQQVGKYLNIVFFLLLLPFCVTFEAQPWWRIPLDVFVILMVYDFFYYCAHRFWFHGNGAMRKVHAVHHQARNPSYLDAHYVHPLETFVGLGGYMLTVVVLSAFMGPFHLATIVLTFVIYFQLNQINHVYFDVPRFPFKTVNWIVAKHHVHHENMHKGNYATITLLYDKLFGTLD